MQFQTVFQRYELKYLLTREQKERILSVMERYMLPDKFGKSTVRNIYFDTDSYRLIRRSNEKPIFKEKLRLRSYCRVSETDTVFAELKRKYNKTVYKRRLPLPESDAMRWLTREAPPPIENQISREIDYFLDFYGPLRPTVFLSYERAAYYAHDSDFRVTFDENILSRTEDVRLSEEIGGIPLLEDGFVLMELKCPGCIPLWMTEVLSRERIYKTSFSKYGTAYNRLIFPKTYPKEHAQHEYAFSRNF